MNSKQNNSQGFLSVMMCTVSPVLTLLTFFSEETDRNRINNKMIDFIYIMLDNDNTLGERVYESCQSWKGCKVVSFILQ